MTVKTGDEAPDFELRSHRGGSVKLSDFRGRKNVVLAFHPLAFTPVCARQMTDYEAGRPQFDERQAVVLGISIDPQPAKTAWAQSLGQISFDLLSDFHPHGAVAEKYGVFRQKEGFSDRAVFVVDKNGRIAWSKVYDIPQQPDINEVFQALGKLPQ
jgi:peroxiredoxin